MGHLCAQCSNVPSKESNVGDRESPKLLCTTKAFYSIFL